MIIPYIILSNIIYGACTYHAVTSVSTLGSRYASKLSQIMHNIRMRMHRSMISCNRINDYTRDDPALLAS